MEYQRTTNSSALIRLSCPGPVLSGPGLACHTMSRSRLLAGLTGHGGAGLDRSSRNSILASTGSHVHGVQYPWIYPRSGSPESTS